MIGLKFKVGDVVKVNCAAMKKSHDMKGIIMHTLQTNPNSEYTMYIMYMVLLENGTRCPYYDYELAHVEI